MSTSDTDELYVISYLIHQSEDSKIIEYTNLAARIYEVNRRIKSDEQISECTHLNFDDLVTVSEDNMIEWQSLKDFIESARGDEVGSMFLSVETKEKEPNEWIYQFNSEAPEAILEQKLEEMSERDEALKQVVTNVAQLDDNRLFEIVY